ncbi:cation diffusion facilitator family transporter [Spongiimicrobium salis]|uniref:cation diffusion facilitator family transporter n=1 Tax=Spongiimicrobium salis TaxID=1667022 RepID=UPI00374DA408
MGHHHHHHHHGDTKNIRLAFFLNLGFTLLEIIGGFYVNSVAIVSDAVHDLGDSLALGTAWYLETKSKKGASDTFSFGYQRLSLLGALLNAIILIVGAIFVVREAIERLVAPEEVDAQGMVVFAIIGILVNGYAAWKLAGETSLNQKLISWHLIEDVLGWVAVLIGALIMTFYGVPWLDAVLSIGISLFILINVVRQLKKVLRILVQAVPKEVDLAQLKKEVLAIKDVASLHSTHLWSLDGEQLVFSTHIRTHGTVALSRNQEIKSEVLQLLSRYHLACATLQIESADEACVFEIEQCKT